MADEQAEAIKAQITQVFPATGRPTAGSLHASIESEEASTLLELDFADKGTWPTLDAAFVDQAPGGFGSALSFLSDEAFRYFVPAYLIADLDDQLDHADPVFHLIQGLTDAAVDQLVNPKRYGDTTWSTVKTARHSGFTTNQVEAIVAYLEYRAEHDEFNRDDIGESLANYWYPRAGVVD